MPKAAIPYTPKQLFAQGPQLTYTGRDLSQIALPLGGIGTGMVSLGGWGQLRDWEIMNRPAKGFVVPEAFFTLKAQRGKDEPVTKVIQGPYMGDLVADGHSVPRNAGQSLPRFREARFTGHFPFADVAFDDERMPLEVSLEAFNPFIPLNDKDSGIPVAVLLYTLKNPTKKAVTATVFGNLTNVIGDGKGQVNEAKSGDGLTGLCLSNADLESTSPRFGTLALVTPCENASVWPRWHTDAGRLSKFYDYVTESDAFPPEVEGHSPTGTVAVRCKIPAGKSVTIPFFITWHFPVVEHWHKPEGCDCAATWRNYYASLWTDAWDVARYVNEQYSRLYEETKRFHDALFASTLPAHVLDAVSSQISILKTTTCLRLEDGTFYAFEGCNCTSGCCEGSCTHVWNYAQALPYLFPALQRSMREADWANSMADDGYVTFRMPLPLGTKATPSFHPAADGQMGTVIQVYREWLISGDDEWLRKMWPSAKKALEFAWKYWDADKDGVMEGMQHNTYDNEFHGPNTMMGSLYLAALRAAEEMAKAAGETDKADEYRKVFESGSAKTDSTLFNREYYEQKVEMDARAAWPEAQRAKSEAHGREPKTNWPKWQFGKGCLSDQMIGQWYAAMLGLGHLYKPANVRKALKSVFNYNWKPDLMDHANHLRIYAMNDEAGLIICTWPKGERPDYAFWFADEVWCGIEYQVASHLIYEGMVDEGLAIVRGVRERHRGHNRNPWDEFECGHHYARSMASYALLAALSGFSYSAPDKRIGFDPRMPGRKFKTFFSVGSGWGLYSQRKQKKGGRIEIEALYGSVTLQTISTPFARKKRSVTASVGKKEVAAKLVAREHVIVLQEPVTLEAGQKLRVSIA